MKHHNKDTKIKAHCRRLILLRFTLCGCRFAVSFDCVIICVIFCREPFSNMSMQFCKSVCEEEGERTRKNKKEGDKLVSQSGEHTFSIASVWRDTLWCVSFHLVIDAQDRLHLRSNPVLFILFMIEFFVVVVVFCLHSSVHFHFWLIRVTPSVGIIVFFFSSAFAFWKFCLGRWIQLIHLLY